jgi:hypothetical protein
MNSMTPNELYDFLRDSDLTEVIEQNKITDDIFEIFNLTENQHSDILAWCMNPNEGHSQGDAVIKDFLEEGYASSSDATWDNKKFFDKWTPGRIRTTSFGSAFVTREFGVEIQNGAKQGRLDLFLIDPHNQILIAIENKAGAKASNEQLDNYVHAIKNGIGNTAPFKDYDKAFILLDRDLYSYSEDHLASLNRRWTQLDYNWLKAPADRARFQIDRGRNASELLVAYCQRQTDWESPIEKRITALASDLAVRYPQVLEAIHRLSKEPFNGLRAKEHEGELALFMAQHRAVCERILSIRGVATVEQQLIKAVPALNADMIATGRTWVSVVPPKVLDALEEEDAYWPVYVNLYRIAAVSRPDAPKFNLRIVWNRSAFDSTQIDEATFREHMAKDFTGLKAFGACDIRRLVLEKNLSLPNAVEAVRKTVEIVESSLKSYWGK